MPHPDRLRDRQRAAYQAQGDEIALFEAAWRKRMPMLLKGPTGCGKTRFVEHMAWRLNDDTTSRPQASHLPWWHGNLFQALALLDREC